MNSPGNPWIMEDSRVATACLPKDLNRRANPLPDQRPYMSTRHKIEQVLVATDHQAAASGVAGPGPRQAAKPSSNADAHRIVNALETL
ncbi:hypothetical protein KSP9073_01193 [Kushneria phyllosphaerae]|uniref:Uncharacterized protein n=1 Tax=Kushneria phyllosphaerae TaxID=2100822 RepID=A0A2R8CJX7_9GAMM|nr:hypothetical protein KSP9073_01193 [Kushneria phyllosphaerae]